MQRDKLRGNGNESTALECQLVDLFDLMPPR